MRITVDYGEKTYGTGSGASSYDITITRSRYHVSLHFGFQQPTRGIGDSWNGRESSGTVRSASLSIPADHARGLAQAILKLCEGEAEAQLILQFAERA